MNPNEKSHVLIEALPYIKKYNGKIVVIKFGGNVFSKLENLVEDIVFLKHIGLKPIVVHGGGPSIDAELKKINVKPKFINGLRKTDDKTLKIIQKVFDQLNNDIVFRIKAHGAKAANCKGSIITKQMHPELGLVGIIIKVDIEMIKKMLEKGLIPIISPLGQDLGGINYNINADTAASRLAVSLRAEKLTILTDVDGVIINKKLVSHISIKNALKEIKKGRINRGMVPKMEACIHAVQGKISKAHLLNGITKHSILLEIFTDKGVGTEIVLENGN